MKNKVVISRLKSVLKENNVDSLLTNKFLYTVLKTSANLLIKREADSKTTINFQSNIWSSISVHMQKVDSLEHAHLSINIPNECELWRSVKPLPEFIETAYGFLYKSITSLDQNTHFILTTPFVAFSKMKLKYNKNRYVWIENGYLYSTHAFPYLKIVGYFEDDLNSNGNQGNCSRLDDEFKCPEYLIDAVIKMALQELMQFKQIQFDATANKSNIS